MASALPAIGWVAGPGRGAGQAQWRPERPQGFTGSPPRARGATLEGSGHRALTSPRGQRRHQVLGPCGPCLSLTSQVRAPEIRAMSLSLLAEAQRRPPALLGAGALLRDETRSGGTTTWTWPESSYASRFLGQVSPRARGPGAGLGVAGPGSSGPSGTEPAPREVLTAAVSSQGPDAGPAGALPPRQGLAPTGPVLLTGVRRARPPPPSPRPGAGRAPCRPRAVAPGSWTCRPVLGPAARPSGAPSGRS